MGVWGQRPLCGGLVAERNELLQTMDHSIVTQSQRTLQPGGTSKAVLCVNETQRGGVHRGLQKEEEGEIKLY